MQTRLIADNARCGFTYAYRFKKSKILDVMWRGYQPFNGNKIAYCTHLDKVEYIKKSEVERNIFDYSFKVCVVKCSTLINFFLSLFFITDSTKNYQKAVKVYL